MTAPGEEKNAKERVVLPTYVIPTTYHLHLKPDLKTFVFGGNVTIDMTTKDTIPNEYKNKILLHSKELSFRKAEYKVVGSEEESIVADEITVNFKTTIVTLTFPKDIPTSSSIKVSIEYDGIINDQMAGFYRSTFKDHFTNETCVIGSTQCEPLDARRILPCIDEPAIKATFLLKLEVGLEYECLANMPESSRVTNYDTTDSSKSTKIISFLETPKMSTYLLAFCVLTNFDFVQTQTKEGKVLIRVYCPRGRTDSATFALESATKCLDVYDDFFGLPYPLPKCDMIAVPDFAMGAMENWGLVTYREVDLLINPITASNAQKQRVATVVGHELAHQWFGNLVTMEWWDDLWLNEGFATWAESWSSDKLYPTHRMLDQFVTENYTRALKLDGLQSSHPIQVPIQHAEEVEQVFDAISYYKGSCIVRMIKAVMGFTNFQKGLQQYMKKHQYSNTITLDLWTAWEEATKSDDGSNGMPIKDMMSSWTEQMGFPLIKVLNHTIDTTKQQIVLELEQSWFLADGSDPNTVTGDGPKEIGKDKLWTIPLLTSTKDGVQDDMILFREKTATVTLPFKGDTADWIKLNAGQEVPMRVQYTPELWSRLSQAVKDKQISPADRVGLIGDAYALVKSNHMKPEDMITFFSAFNNEQDLVVWESLSEAISGLESILSSSSSDAGQLIYKNFIEFGRKLILPLVELIGWDDDKSKPTDHLTAMFRGTMVSMLSKFCADDPNVANEVSSRCKLFFTDPETNVNSIPTDIKTPVFKMYVKNGGKDEYDTLKSYYYKAKDNAERKHVLHSLGNTKISNLQLSTLEWTSFSGDVKVQDFFYGIGPVSSSSKQGQQIAWSFMKDNFEKLKNLLKTASPSLMNAVIVYSAGTRCSKDDVDEFEQFFKDNPLPHSSRRIAQLIESMRANVKFLNQLESSDLSKPEFWSGL